MESGWEELIDKCMGWVEKIVQYGYNELDNWNTLQDLRREDKKRHSEEFKKWQKKTRKIVKYIWLQLRTPDVGWRGKQTTGKYGER